MLIKNFPCFFFLPFSLFTISTTFGWREEKQKFLIADHSHHNSKTESKTTHKIPPENVFKKFFMQIFIVYFVFNCFGLPSKCFLWITFIAAFPPERERKFSPQMEISFLYRSAPAFHSRRTRTALLWIYWTTENKIKNIVQILSMYTKYKKRAPQSVCLVIIVPTTKRKAHVCTTFE